MPQRLKNVLDLQEEQRKKIAREIHDELGQALTALKIDLSYLRYDLGIEQPKLVSQLEALGSRVDEIIANVRKIVTELRPGVLDNLGFLAAAQWQIQEFGKKTGILCHVELPESLPCNPHKDHETTLFRILQETLTNVSRHAQATIVSVICRLEKNEIYMQIKDNGIGIKTDAIDNPSSMGLLGMRERLKSLNGRMDIQGNINQGTSVEVWVQI